MHGMSEGYLYSVFLSEHGSHEVPLQVFCTSLAVAFTLIHACVCLFCRGVQRRPDVTHLICLNVGDAIAPHGNGKISL